MAGAAFPPDRLRRMRPSRAAKNRSVHGSGTATLRACYRIV
jgi:hypothetical protein